MNGIQKLTTSELCGREFTVYGTPEAPLFLAKEVAEIIGHSDVSKMIQSVDDDEKVLGTMFGEPNSKGGNPNKWLLTEDGLYEVLMQSRKPIAKTFKKGIKQILHDVRTHGMYMTTENLQRVMNDPDFLIGLLEGYKAEKEQNRLLTQQNNILEGEKEALTSRNREMTPKADYFDDVLQSDTTYTFTQIAKELGFTSALKLIAMLQKNKIIYKQSDQWLAYAKYSDKGYFKTRTARFYHSDGRPGSSISTVITESGRQWIHSRMPKKELAN